MTAPKSFRIGVTIPAMAVATWPWCRIRIDDSSIALALPREMRCYSTSIPEDGVVHLAKGDIVSIRRTGWFISQGVEIRRRTRFGSESFRCVRPSWWGERASVEALRDCGYVVTE